MHAPRQTGFPVFQFTRSLRKINLLQVRSHRKNKRGTMNEDDKSKTEHLYVYERHTHAHSR